MGDAGGECCGFLCGTCCIGLFSGLAAFCNTKTYGAGNNSGGNAGCCGKCFKSSFDEDGFEEAVKKDMEKTRDPNAKVKEPEPVPQMSTTRTLTPPASSSPPPPLAPTQPTPMHEQPAS